MLRIASFAVGFGISVYKLPSPYEASTHVESTVENTYSTPLPTRSELIASLKEEDTVYDVLVIGGGATGCGVALDAVTRGSKTALVEKYDYSSGTSSKSTKLIHGGVRYLQKAIMGLDREQYHLVKEALYERSNVLKLAPHLTSPLPIMLPVYKWWQVPYFWVGIKMYDLVAGRQLVKKSYYINKKKTLEMFPMLASTNLCGSIIYYDGQQNDARVNLMLALSAIRNGAKCTNHVEVVNLLFEENKQDSVALSKVCGAHVRDRLTGDEWDIKAKCVINATGPFTDSIRDMGKDSKKICQPASGAHIVLPEYYCPKTVGLLDPATSDGRVVFVLPWEGRVVAGTTDHKCDVTFDPKPTEEEILFILEQIKKYLQPNVEVRREDVIAAWSGLRPLVIDPNSKDTQSISRNHVIEISQDKLVTIAGGKWTTYRSMAKDAVDSAVKEFHLETRNECVTDKLLLEGGEGWNDTHYIRLAQEHGIETEVAEHLSHNYGTKANEVIDLAESSGKRWPVKGRKLVNDFPFIKAEILYGIKHEYACTVVDVIARRMRLAFLNVSAAMEILPFVTNIMAAELGWDSDRKKIEMEKGINYLKTMGLDTSKTDNKMK